MTLPPLPLPLPAAVSSKPRVMAADDFAAHRNLASHNKACAQMRAQGFTRNSYPSGAAFLAEIERRAAELRAAPPALPLPLPLPLPRFP